jgi:TetR/AcrR family transcriptional regulator, mexJK operon transcriptional repressor
MTTENLLRDSGEIAEEPSRSARKRKAVLNAALPIFFENGYLGANMDEIAVAAGVSKQTAYVYFASKEALFVEFVTSKCKEAGDMILGATPELTADQDVQTYLFDYAYRQLTVVMTPDLMRLRRLVIGEVNRFPQLARALYEYGPKRATDNLTKVVAQLRDWGLLFLKDPLIAASHFNWLVMGNPVNQAMLLGDDAIPKPDELRDHANEAVSIFLAAYGRR